MTSLVVRPPRGLAAALLAVASAQPAWALGERQFVTFDAGKDAVVLARAGQAARIIVDRNEFTGVRRAAADLRGDIGRVSGARPALLDAGTAVASGTDVVIVGTLGRSALVDRLAATGCACRAWAARCPA